MEIQQKSYWLRLNNDDKTDAEMGRWGDWETRRWGDGETRRKINDN
ncbi:hypothetical protein [Calothrix sp. UHCC 0171]|nr:hypothetical protein [Calothrix sp. UHCC 0171]MEA5572019.1 hypothetical protein [Calothrix sp. UHCC 0171]